MAEAASVLGSRGGGGEMFPDSLERAFNGCKAGVTAEGAPATAANADDTSNVMAPDSIEGRTVMSSAISRMKQSLDTSNRTLSLEAALRARLEIVEGEFLPYLMR